MRVSPGEVFRTFCNSCQLGDSLASTIRLRTPSCSMKAMTFCWAPAPMESMATTAATPKIMPSMVRRERNLWLVRFSKPKARSGSHCCRDRGSAMEPALKIISENIQANCEAGVQPRVGAIELNGHIELVPGVFVPEFVARRPANGLHFAPKGFAGKRIDLYFHGLTCLEVDAVGFTDLRGNVKVRHVDHFRDRASRIDLITDVIIRECHSPHEKTARGIPIALDYHKTVDGRGDVHVFDVLLGLFHGKPGLVPFFLADCQSRLVGGGVRLDVLLKLGQSALGFVEGQQVFLCIDGAHQFVLADFQLRAPNRVLCFQERGLVLRRLDVGVRLGFYDLLLRLQQVAAILSEIVFLLAGIKFEDYVAGVDVCSRAGQRDNLQRAATDGWSRDGPRLAGPQDSRRGNFEL